MMKKSALLLISCLALVMPAQATSAQDINQASSQTVTQTAAQTGEVDTPVQINTPHDSQAPSLAEIAAPNDSTLSRANAELLVKNAELERRINDLTTQVNVLTHERSGQLFLYGALTVLVTIGLCVLAGALISMRGQRSRW
ncbi:hypothetical protein LU290_04345 [Moraxella nasibovis]|uniref:hypothetical protein n=1 Tax=Moraxella nasibovis TaxID=2904120 RepID=UPI0024106B1A|nr:hypothetical protein [Moraxella nasibovis]WFF39454.1 hypothetical protein LU290_04345 [Moraxella nasibovis]